MKVDLTVRDDTCCGRITHDDTRGALDIRVEGENLAEVLAKLINTFTEWQQMAMQRLREVGALGHMEVVKGGQLKMGEPS